MGINRFAFIIPYFGKLPHWFQFWLNSCGNNPHIDWLLFTDDHYPFRYPKNVLVHYCSFEDIRQLVQKNFDFEITLHKPYKLCAYKPAYGEIFSMFLLDYDFWGYCDIDLIWGNLEKWLCREEVFEYDRISHWGHCSLYRNNKESNAIYRIKVEGVNYYKDIYTNSSINGFDEECGMNVITRAIGIKEYIIPFIDVKPSLLSYGLTPTFTSDPFFPDIVGQMCFSVNKENLTMFAMADDGNLFSKDFAYVHLQRRKIAVEVNDSVDQYLIVPNKFIPFENVNIDFIKKNTPSPAKEFLKHKQTIWKSRFNVIKNKVF